METFSALLALCAGNTPSPVNSSHKGQWHWALMFSLICTWINGWINNREAGDLRHQCTHYNVTAMTWCQCHESSRAKCDQSGLGHLLTSNLRILVVWRAWLRQMWSCTHWLWECHFCPWRNWMNILWLTGFKLLVYMSYIDYIEACDGCCDSWWGCCLGHVYISHKIYQWLCMHDSKLL